MLRTLFTGLSDLKSAEQRRLAIQVPASLLIGNCVHFPRRRVLRLAGRSRRRAGKAATGLVDRLAADGSPALPVRPTVAGNRRVAN